MASIAKFPTVGRYVYRVDHWVRAALIVSLAVNVGLAILVWVLIGLLEVWR